MRPPPQHQQHQHRQKQQQQHHQQQYPILSHQVRFKQNVKTLPLVR